MSPAKLLHALVLLLTLLVGIASVQVFVFGLAQDLALRAGEGPDSAAMIAGLAAIAVAVTHVVCLTREVR